ncbi:COG1470 family protein [Archaeoglobus veneficus]|uniref:COG1470 family protein n=1 Tax=Archaeoglobus veneficus TaxID=58290 RepID=UPI000AB29634|nr:hypothetical protein [Archaeoglobus veneficus]
MGKILKVLVLILLLGAVFTVQAQMPVPQPIVVSKTEVSGAVYTPSAKLKITPAFKHLRLQPGESTSFEVKVKNIGSEDVTIEPKLVQMPYPANAIEEEWIKIEPERMVLKAKEEGKIKVEVTVPGDAEKGFYNAMIALTNDTVSMPYPTPYSYVNALSLSINVWIPPQVVIKQRYIMDTVEAGKSYEYKVVIENRGRQDCKPESQA